MDVFCYSVSFWFHLSSAAHFVQFKPIHKHIHTHLDTPITTYPATLTPIYAQPHTRMCLHTHVSTYSPGHTSAHTCNTHTHIYSPILLLTYTHPHPHTHKDIHTLTKPHTNYSSKHWCLLLPTEIIRLHSKLLHKTFPFSQSYSLQHHPCALMKVRNSFLTLNLFLCFSFNLLNPRIWMSLETSEKRNST